MSLCLGLRNPPSQNKVGRKHDVRNLDELFSWSKYILSREEVQFRQAHIKALQSNTGFHWINIDVCDLGIGFIAAVKSKIEIDFVSIDAS